MWHTHWKGLYMYICTYILAFKFKIVFSFFCKPLWIAHRMYSWIELSLSACLRYLIITIVWRTHPQSASVHSQSATVLQRPLLAQPAPTQSRTSWLKILCYSFSSLLRVLITNYWTYRIIHRYFVTTRCCLASANRTGCLFRLCLKTQSFAKVGLAEQLAGWFNAVVKCAVFWGENYRCKVACRGRPGC